MGGVVVVGLQRGFMGKWKDKQLEGQGGGFGTGQETPTDLCCFLTGRHGNSTEFKDSC